MKFVSALAITVLASAFAVTAAAQNEVGNAGTGVYCEDRAPRVELLDFFEAPVYGNVIDLGGPTLSLQEKIDLALNRLDRLDPTRAARYRSEARAFASGETATFESGISLQPVNDSYARALPPGCELRHLSNFRRPLLTGDKIYVVDADLWQEMDVDGRAGLALHEVVYREAVWDLGHVNSLRVRRFIALLASPAMEALSVADYHRVMHELGLDGFDLSRGIKFKFGSAILDDAGRLQSGRLLRQQRLSVCPEDRGLDVTPMFRAGEMLTFHPNGVLGTGTTDATMLYPIAEGRRIGLRGRLAFHDNCQIASGVYWDAATLEVADNQGHWTQVRQLDLVSFDRAGRLVSVTRR